MSERKQNAIFIGMMVTFFLMFLAILLCKLDENHPRHRRWRNAALPSTIVEGVVEKAERISPKLLEVTIDGEKRLFQTYFNPNDFYIGEYHTFIVTGDKIEHIYFGESSCDLAELEELY